MNRSWLRFWILLFSAIGLSGCLEVSKPYPEQRKFMFQIERTEPVQPAPRNGVILQVLPFDISEAFQGQSFVYRTNRNTWESDFYNIFFDAPASLLTDQTREYLQRAGVAEHVSGVGAYADPTHILEAHIATMYVDFQNRESPTAVFEIRFTVTRLGASPRILYSKNFRERERVNPGDYSDRVLGERIMTAWNRALQRVLIDFESDLKSLDWKTGDFNGKTR